MRLCIIQDLQSEINISEFVKLSLLLLLLFIIIFSASFYKTFAASSPSFGLQERTDKRNQWVQTYGNDSSHLKSATQIY
jgi:hypothetical protein